MEKRNKLLLGGIIPFDFRKEEEFGNENNFIAGTEM